MSVATVEVPAAHRFDEAALDRFLAAQLPEYGGSLRVRQFPGGFSNPTFALDTLDRAGQPRAYVMRKRPLGDLLPSAHRVDREFRVLRALGKHTELPVPRARALCEDPAVLGTSFFVMDRVDGRLSPDPALPAFTTAERGAVWHDLVTTLARLHAVDPAGVGLADYGKPDGFLRRQVELWTRQYRMAQTDDVPEMQALGDWLAAHVPPTARISVIHGDYRTNNLLLHPREPRIAAILDWELSTLGDPACDVAYTCLCYHVPDPPVGFGGQDPERLGIPSQAAFLDAYAARSGLDVHAHWPFHMALQLYKSASLLQGVVKRAMQGSAPAAGLAKRDEVRRRAQAGLGFT